MNTTCLAPSDSPFHASAVIAALGFLFIIRVFFYKFIPNMLSRMSVGLVFILIIVLYKVNHFFTLKDLTCHVLQSYYMFLEPCKVYLVSSIIGVYSSSVSSTHERSDDWIVVYYLGYWYPFQYHY